jgi:hypothetical protein
MSLRSLAGVAVLVGVAALTGLVLVGPIVLAESEGGTREPVVAAFGALGVVGVSIVVLAAVQRRRADERAQRAIAEVPPPFAPTEAQLAAFEADPLMAALNRRAGARARTTDPDAPAWVRRMKSQGQSEDRSGEP